MADPTPSALSATQSWQAGRPDLPVVLAHYQVLGVLGRGGMGTVYKGYHLNLKRPVAIKTLRLDRLGRPDLLARFLREMEIVGRLDHPNVVRATDAGERNGIFFLVMEYLDGRDLEHVLLQQGPLAAPDACAVGHQAAVALAYIHQQGLVHRDIKPSNLLLTAAGLVKVLDLGLARLDQAAVVQHTPEGFALGTYDYVAPEQAADAAGVDGRADVYSLGCTLFKLLTGRVPYSGPAYDTLPRKLFAHEHVPLEQVEGFAALPNTVQPILARMTAKNPVQRWSADEVAQALAPLAAGSQLQRLVGAEVKPDSSVQPLPIRVPEDIHALTEVPRETPLQLPGPMLPPPSRARAFARRAGIALAALGVAAALLLVAGWYAGWFAPHSVAERPGQKKAMGDGAQVPALNDWPVQRYHLLLDRPPLAIGPGVVDEERWRWDGGRQAIAYQSPDDALFLLGTTTAARYEFEVAIAQAPWTGGVGVVWGYREDAAAKAAHAAGKDFAHFQTLVLWRDDPEGKPAFAVQRGWCTVGYDERGELRVNKNWRKKHTVGPLLHSEKVLVIAVDRERLRRVLLNSEELKPLCSDETNAHFKDEAYRGGLGLVSLGNSVTFTKARYMSLSKQ